MRVLLLCEGDAETWDSWSGLTRSVVDHLRAEGHVVVCGDSDLRGFDRFVTALRSFAPDRRRWWVRYHLGPDGFRARSQRAERIVSQQRERPDVILQIGATFHLTERSGIPYVLYCDSNIELARQGAASGHSEATMLAAEELEAIREREAVVYAGAARIFTTSHKLREVFIAHFGVDERRVETIHAGPNFPYGESPEVPARTPNGPPTILFVGRAFHRKGGDLLLEAFKQVRHRIPDARLTILGPDAMPPGVEGAPGVDFVGFVNKATPEGQARINQAYASARVFCLPTRFEPFGVVFLEAMHYALPVVAPRAWAVPEIVEDGVTGRTVDPENVDALAGALIDLLSDPEKARTFGLAGKRRLEEHFSWARVVNRMTRALTDLLSREKHRV